MRSMSAQGLDGAAKLSRGWTSRALRGERAKPSADGTPMLSADYAHRIAMTLRVSQEWLVHGIGEPTSGVIPLGPRPDTQPNRVPVYDSDDFRQAPPELQAWFKDRRRKPDLSTADWEIALSYARRLHAFGLLDVPKGNSVNKPK
jgi:hypothetical protein